MRRKTGSAARTLATRGRQAGRGRGRQPSLIPPQADVVVNMTDMDSSDEDNASVAAPVPVPAPAPAPAPVPAPAPAPAPAPVPMTPTGRPRNPLNIALERKIHLIRQWRGVHAVLIPLYNTRIETKHSLYVLN